MTCMRTRMLASSAPVTAGEVLARFTISTTCSTIGRAYNTIIWSVGSIAAATAVIHSSFRGVSLFISQASCCSRESNTPWLRGRGDRDMIPCKPTWQKKHDQLFSGPYQSWDESHKPSRLARETRARKSHIFHYHHVPRLDRVRNTWLHSQDTIATSLLWSAIVKASSYLHSDINLFSSFVGSNCVSTWVIKGRMLRITSMITNGFWQSWAAEIVKITKHNRPSPGS